MHKPLNAQKPYNLHKAAYIAQSRSQTCAKFVQPTQSRIQLRNQSATDVFLQINKQILSIMARSEKEKSPRFNYDWKIARKVNSPISLEYLMVKKLPLSLEDGYMRKLSVRKDPSNEDSNHVKQKSAFWIIRKTL